MVELTSPVWTLTDEFQHSISLHNAGWGNRTVEHSLRSDSGCDRSGKVLFVLRWGYEGLCANAGTSLANRSKNIWLLTSQFEGPKMV